MCHDLDTTDPTQHRPACKRPQLHLSSTARPGLSDSYSKEWLCFSHEAYAGQVSSHLKRTWVSISSLANSEKERDQKADQDCLQRGKMDTKYQRITTAVREHKQGSQSRSVFIRVSMWHTVFSQKDSDKSFFFFFLSRSYLFLSKIWLKELTKT